MIKINSDVLEVMELIENNGYEVYIVGGFVRDSIIGRISNDYDLCTNIPLELLKEKMPSLSMMSKNEHRITGIINKNGIDIEITEFKGNTLYDDLYLRDLTINSIALSKDGKYIDPLNGIDDIKNKILRFNPNTIDYDPRALLRLIRFEGMLGFEVETESLEEALNKKYKINDIGSDRARKEIIKILLCENPGNLILKYKDIFFEIIPELGLIDFDILMHIVNSLNSSSCQLSIRLAILFNNLENGVDIFNNFAKKYNIEKSIRQKVNRLLYFYGVPMNTDDVEMAKFIRGLGVENLDLLFEMKLIDINGSDNIEECMNKIINLRNIYLKFLETKPVLGIKDLEINGRSLSQMDFDSKLVGVILNDVLEKVMNKELSNKKEELEDYVGVKYR